MVPEPELPDSITPADLDKDVRADLRGLQKETAEKVARHLVAAGLLVDEEPERALAHVRYARRRASRIGVVREAAGIVAYHAGEWNEALGEFRAARRMGGGPGHVPVMADIERALGRPERALELTRGPEVRDLGEDERIELLIVAAGARRDLGELDAAVVGLQIPELDPKRREPWSARLFYAYADNLLAVDRRAEAVQWFVHAHDADTEEQTDAADRIAELTGDELPGTGDDGLMFGVEDVPDADMVPQLTEDDVEDVEADAGEADSPKAQAGTVQFGTADVDAGDVDAGDVEAAGIDTPESDTAESDTAESDIAESDTVTDGSDSSPVDESDPGLVVDDTAESAAAAVDTSPTTVDDAVDAEAVEGPDDGPSATEVLGVVPAAAEPAAAEPAPTDGAQAEDVGAEKTADGTGDASEEPATSGDADGDGARS